jgi:hypothetical protein
MSADKVYRRLGSESGLENNLINDVLNYQNENSLDQDLSILRIKHPGKDQRARRHQRISMHLGKGNRRPVDDLGITFLMQAEQTIANQLNAWPRPQCFDMLYRYNKLCKR